MYRFNIYIFIYISRFKVLNGEHQTMEIGVETHYQNNN